ncbi:NAD kinase [Haloplasma contractile]|uniref:NAD kinase n=1 Tax=Haloplasma contractile SSD-17B TaxID=1033810 RepID=U2DST9_9MOLU|nr:NAD kinase [Haloplasma contractile]ERJ11557.1 putative inorganic polyphosphate-ATP-NAD kinase 1 protein [Haloplasma contractile SSD-17B]
MNYCIFSKLDEYSTEVAERLKTELSKLGYEYNREEPELIFTIGGDGTMLKTVHKFIDRLEEVSFIGIHTGKLGFYTDFTPEEIDFLVDKMKDNLYDEIHFPLLETTICSENGCEEIYALNEITLMNPYRTQFIEVYIDQDHFESFRGTGLCVSTPTGSSAYNKSLGGAVMHPKIEAFQLTEMASINSNVYRTISAPIILAKNQTLILRAADFNRATITIDHYHRDLKNYKYVKCKLSDKRVRFRQYRENDFWNRIKRSFL